MKSSLILCTFLLIGFLTEAEAINFAAPQGRIVVLEIKAKSGRLIDPATATKEGEGS